MTTKVANLTVENSDGTLFFAVEGESELLQVPAGVLLEKVDQYLDTGNDTVYHLNFPPSSANTTQEETDSFNWNSDTVLLLINEYKVLQPLVENGKIKTKKKMWQKMWATFQEQGHNIENAMNLENKWKSLERAYKNAMHNKHRNGPGRKTCPFEKELDEVFGSSRLAYKSYYALDNKTIANYMSPNSSIILKKNPQGINVICEELKKLRETLDKDFSNRREEANKKIEIRKGILEEMKRKNDVLEKIAEKL